MTVFLNMSEQNVLALIYYVFDLSDRQAINFSKMFIGISIA